MFSSTKVKSPKDTLHKMENFKLFPVVSPNNETKWSFPFCSISYALTSKVFQFPAT